MGRAERRRDGARAGLYRGLGCEGRRSSVPGRVSKAPGSAAKGLAAQPRMKAGRLEDTKGSEEGFRAVRTECVLS